MSEAQPCDRIPSIDSSKFILATETDCLFLNRRVIGNEIECNYCGYPLAILNWHGIVSDTSVEFPVSITFYPLCGTRMAFHRNFDGMVTTLGVSGLLYKSDILLYYRKSKSLWSQVMAQAVNGLQKGELLVSAQIEHTTW